MNNKQLTKLCSVYARFSEETRRPRRLVGYNPTAAPARFDKKTRRIMRSGLLVYRGFFCYRTIVFSGGKSFPNKGALFAKQYSPAGCCQSLLDIILPSLRDVSFVLVSNVAQSM